MRTLASAMSLVGREALRIVLPSWCVVCERELPWRDRTASCCASCWANLPKITGSKCDSCALPLAHGATLCISCIAEPLPLQWCDAWGEYRGSLERIVGALKFERHDFLDDAIASLLEETLRVRGDVDFDAIACVPMSPAKQRRRGYNQAALLGRALARRIGVGCDMTLLGAAAERATQSKLPKRERAANVRGAFSAASRVKGKSILVVDDICTTGETLRACATALLREGAGRVCAVTVAKAV